MKSSDRARRIERLFQEAHSLPPERRRAFLDQHALSDPSLIDEVRSLLEQETTHFLDHPASLETFQHNDLVAGRFSVIRQLGRGGMGEVYEAYDPELTCNVAIKTIRTELATIPRAAQRFRQEVRLAREISHPNVCKVHDIHTHILGGEPRHELLICSMELLHGETLAAAIRRGPFAAETALPLVRQMAAGLAAAHDKHVIHRDFKPSNVFLVPSENGQRALITDFGLARSMESAEPLTVLGEIVGTPAYMAPEQIRGEAVTPATDIYAMGVVIYEMITGKRPKSANSSATTVSPRQLVSTLSEQWEKTILTCMQRDPAARFQSAAAVITALEGVTIRDLVPPRPRRTNWSRRAALAVGLTGVGAGGYFAYREAAHRQNCAPRDAANREANERFLEGQELFRTQQNRTQLQTVIDKFEASLKSDPNFALAHARLADALVVMARTTRDRSYLDRADYSARQAQKLADCLPEAYFALGSVNSDLKRPEEAQVALRRGLDLGKPEQQAEGYRRLGRLYVEQGKKDAALAALEKSVQLNSYDLNSATQLAAAYFRYGMDEKAIGAYERLTSLAPNRAEGFQGLGAAYLRSGAVEEALTPLRRALELQKTVVNFNGLAAALFYLHRYSQAADLYEQAAKLSPKNFVTLYNLGSTYHYAGLTNEANRNLNLAAGLAQEELSRNQKSSSALETVAFCLARRRRFDEALSQIREAQNFDPSSASLLYSEAAILALAQDSEIAVAKLKQAAAKGYQARLIGYDPDFDTIRHSTHFVQFAGQLPSSKGTRKTD